MSYPPAPWKANGFTLQMFRLVDIERARLCVPPDLQVVPIVPGKTLGAVYAASYGPGSALEYNELIISPALTRHGRTVRHWISHIYVDNRDSMAGGREIWGLPKEMAQFTWSQDRREIVVRQDGQLLCAMRCGSPRWLLRMPILLFTFSILGADLLAFKVTITGRLGIAGGSLDVPAGSPFAALKLAARGWTLAVRNIAFTANAPYEIATLPGS